PIRIDAPFDELQKAAGTTNLSFALGYPKDNCLDQALIDEAVAIAQAAEVALLYIALPSFKESEGYDRDDLDLTKQQVKLIQAVTAVQPNTVVILNNGAPVVMGAWIDNTAAILEAWMMGQAGAGAIADILYGHINPSGKLAETYPHKLSDTPAHLNFPGENDTVRYGEALFIGYRYYDAKEMPLLFPFGYGLSYTTFAYDNLQVHTEPGRTVSANSFNDEDGVTVSVDVTNTGKVAGQEIVQLYVHDQKSRLKRPFKELKGFAKVSLAPGETKTISITLNFRAFAYYDPAYRQWITETGKFDILIGASAADIRCRTTITLQSTLQLPTILHDQSTIRSWYNDPVGKPILEPMFRELMKKGGPFGSDNSKDGTIGVDMLNFLMDLPLRSFLQFQESFLTQPADDIVDMLLKQVHATME
ncbi:MAG: glycosyl hydrolase, partial [Chloroflexi bacterium]